jgi:hypothetical protein
VKKTGFKVCLSNFNLQCYAAVDSLTQLALATVCRAAKPPQRLVEDESSPVGLCRLNQVDP